MNRPALSLVASVLTLGAIPFAQAQTGSTTAPGADARGLVIADHVRTRAEVQEINYTDRTVVLKGEDGRTVMLKVGPQAKNFDRVNVGDQVQADFYTSTAIVVRKSNEPPSARREDVVQLAAPGETPGGVIVSTREISAKVDAVDPQKRVITLTGPSGNTAKLKVGDDVKNLDQIKAGDQVVVRYSEALALAVDQN
jgi:hypothetical protein